LLRDFHGHYDNADPEEKHSFLFVQTIEKLSMETRFLETFLVVAEHGSLAEAARRLGVTPAAISQRVQALEEEIGSPLLTRSGRRVRPTEAGHAILGKSRQLLKDIRDLKALVHGEDHYGELRLGAISTALTGFLPNALRHVFDTAPGADVFLLPGTSAALYQQLGDEKIDAAIIVKPPFDIPKTFHWEPIRREPFVLLTPNEAADRSVEDLLSEQPFIRYDRSMWGGRMADAWLREHQIQPQERIEIDALNAIAVFVHQGLGVALIPDWTPPWPEGLQVVRIPLPPPAPVRRMGLVWSEGPKAALARALVEQSAGTGPAS